MLKNFYKFHKIIFIFLCFIIPAIWWTRLNANYYSTKTFLLFFTSSFALIGLVPQLKLPKLPKALLYSTTFILVYQLIFYTYRLDYADFLNYFKFFSFSALCLYFYNMRSNLEEVFSKTTYLILFTAAFLLAVPIKEFYTLRILNDSTELGLIATFGNINMFAEFFILALPFVFEWTRHKDKISQWAKLAILVIWIFFVLYCRSRSAWIGLALWMVLLLRYKVTKSELISIGLAFVLYFMSVLAPSKPNGIEASKNYNSVARLELIKATFEMIKDHPWGIKAGGFIGEIVPYQMASNVKPSEFSYYDQPHSEIMKWPAQFGWLFSLGALVFLGTVSFIMLRWVLAAQNFFLTGSFAVLVPQLFFQFPYENPASLLYLSFATALFFLSFPVLKEFTLGRIGRLGLVLMAAVGIWNSYAFVNSVYQESTHPRTEKIIPACAYYPINIKACHAKLVYFIDNKRFPEFLEHFKYEFVREPLFVDYLRLLPTYYSLKPNNKKTCQSLFLYRGLFPKTQTFDAKYYENCKVFPDVFYFESPQQYRATFIKWLDNLN